jgi:hypothetical protein
MSVLRSLFFITLLALWTGGPARAASWQDAIDEVRTKEKKYHEMATTIGWPVHAGTMYNELDIPQHSCAILGRMLGKMNLIKHLEKVYPTTSVDGEEFRLAAISLGNWAHTAEFLLKMDKSRRIKSWTLDCVGRMGIPASAYISDYGAATFFDVDEQTLRILGDVESGFPNKLFSAIKENPKIKYVALGSGGGSVLEALTAGRIIRKLRLETTLWNNCYSAWYTDGTWRVGCVH